MACLPLFLSGGGGLIHVCGNDGSFGFCCGGGLLLDTDVAFIFFLGCGGGGGGVLLVVGGVVCGGGGSLFVCGGGGFLLWWWLPPCLVVAPSSFVAVVIMHDVHIQASHEPSHVQSQAKPRQDKPSHEPRVHDHAQASQPRNYYYQSARGLHIT